MLVACGRHPEVARRLALDLLRRKAAVVDPDGQALFHQVLVLHLGEALPPALDLAGLAVVELARLLPEP